MRQRILVFLCIVLCLSLVACSSAPNTSKPSTPAPTSSAPASSGESNVVSFDEFVEIEYMGWSNNKLDGTDPVFKAIEQKFNMKLTYTSVPTGEYANFSSMRIASGDIPELFKTEVPNDSGMGIYRQLYLDGVIINLSDYIEKYNFKNLKKIFEYPTVDLLKEKDGYYLIPNILGPSLQALYVREDWKKKLNLDTPKTYDEYKEFLRKIVQADPDGQKTTGLTISGIDGLEHIFSAFTGKSGNWVNYNGEWVHKVMIPAFKDGVKYCADLYAEGLLDPEFAIMNNSTIQEKIASGKAACLILNGTAAWYNPMNDALKAYNPEGELSVLVPWPAGPAGEVKNGGTPYYGAVHIYKDTTEAQRTRILAFLDWTFTDECLDLFYYGIEGIQHNVVDGKKVINQEAKNAITFGRDLYLFYDILYNQSQWNYITIEPLVKNREWVGKHGVNDEVIGLSTDVTRDIAPRLTDVYKKWIVDFVTGAKNIDADWDKFIAEFKSVGYDDYQKEVIDYMSSK